MKCRERYRFRPQLEALADRLPPSSATIRPPQSNRFGQTYGEWSAAWWQWASSISVDHNPILDQTGADAAVGQAGHVWFLAGNAGGTTERTVTVPAGTALFFPIVTFDAFNGPDENETIEFWRALTRSAI